MNDKIQLKRGTLANWLKVDPVLMDGELALVATYASKPTVYDSKKVGDGIHKFSELEMLGYECLQELGDSQQFPVSQKAITDWINKGYQFRGIATPSTNPGTPDCSVFYLATEAGTYSNFNGISVADGEAVILEWKGSWVKKTTGFSTQQQVARLDETDKKIIGDLSYKLDKTELPIKNVEEPGIYFVDEKGNAFMIYSNEKGLDVSKISQEMANKVLAFLAIEQELGDSPTSVISQKAVTDAIADVKNNIKIVSEVEEDGAFLCNEKGEVFARFVNGKFEAVGIELTEQLDIDITNVVPVV